MSVRVDLAKPRDGGGWEWSIKGYKGRGIYVRLVTDASGRGLYLLDEDTQRMGEQFLDDTFFVLPSAPKSLATQVLEEALLRLGWGPIIHEHKVRSRQS